MTKKVEDLQNARRERRQKAGWTIEQIKENAKKELKEFKKISENEPRDLASGDMDKIIKGEDDEDEHE